MSFDPDMTPGELLDELNHPTTALVNPAAAASYPTGLALDLVLNPEIPLPQVMESYGLTPEEFKRILRNPSFRREYDQHKEDLKNDGWSFKQKAKAQADRLLHTVWGIVHDPKAPSTVKADLIKSVVKWAGYDAPASQPLAGQATMVTLPGSDTQVPAQLLEQLKAMPDAELEARVTHILLRRGQRVLDPEEAAEAALEHILPGGDGE